MTLAYIGIAIVAALVLLTVLWGVFRPGPERPPKQSKRYDGFRRQQDESDLL
jgi:hypothetical protein